MLVPAECPICREQIGPVEDSDRCREIRFHVERVHPAALAEAQAIRDRLVAFRTAYGCGVIDILG